MVGCARNPYLIQILIPTMHGHLMMDYHQATHTVVIGGGPQPLQRPLLLTLKIYSEILLALRAPSTTKCDMCQVSFCGINIQGRCVAAPIAAQQAHGLVDLGDLIECPYVYDCFDGNTVEVEIMLDYLTAQRLTPKNIYREVGLSVKLEYKSLPPLCRLSRKYNPNLGDFRSLSKQVYLATSTASREGQNLTQKLPELVYVACVLRRSSFGVSRDGGSESDRKDFSKLTL